MLFSEQHSVLELSVNCKCHKIQA